MRSRALLLIAADSASQCYLTALPSAGLSGVRGKWEAELEQRVSHDFLIWRPLYCSASLGTCLPAPKPEVLASAREVGINSQLRCLKGTEEQLPAPVRFCWELSGHGEWVYSPLSACLIVSTWHLRTVIGKPFAVRLGSSPVSQLTSSRLWTTARRAEVAGALLNFFLRSPRHSVPPWNS